MINTPFNYTGNKFKLLEQILPEFDYTKENFYDLFVGGGSVYTNVVDKYSNIYINDIIDDLIDIHRELIYNSNEFVNLVKSISPDKNNKEDYLKLRESYNYEKSAAKLFALMLSCQNNLMRFNQSFKFNQTFGCRSFNESTQKKIDIFVEHLSKYKEKLYFTSASFDDIKIKNNSFIYMDPPYSAIKNIDGTPSNKKISEAGYNAYYSTKDDIKLYNYCLDINNNNNTFVLSGVLKHDGNISWLLDKLIQDGFKYKILDYNYNKVARKKEDKETIEVIIKNF